jgi:RNA polymerase sigma factor (sigma-70 family)
MELTSATLLMRLKQDGTPREIAWAEFRRRYAPIIAGFARNMGVRPGETDDLIQEVITGFYAAQPRFVYDPERGRFRGYLKTCVGNLLSRRAATSRLRIDGRPVEILDPADPAIERAWEASWQNEQLAQAIERVRAHYDDNATFRAFYLVSIENRSVSEVSADLGMSIESVYQAKSRCMVRLRATLRQIEEEEG